MDGGGPAERRIGLTPRNSRRTSRLPSRHDWSSAPARPPRRIPPPTTRAADHEAGVGRADPQTPDRPTGRENRLAKLGQKPRRIPKTTASPPRPGLRPPPCRGRIAPAEKGSAEQTRRQRTQS